MADVLIIEQSTFPGPVGMIPKGTWNAQTQYLTRDLVTFNGSSWLSLKLNTNVLPSTNRPDVWQLIAKAGLTDSNLVFRGEWSNLLDYDKNDVVLYGTSSYIALESSINKLPNLETVYWSLLAAGATTAPRDDIIEGGLF